MANPPYLWVPRLWIQLTEYRKYSNLKKVAFVLKIYMFFLFFSNQYSMTIVYTAFALY